MKIFFQLLASASASIFCTTLSAQAIIGVYPSERNGGLSWASEVESQRVQYFNARRTELEGNWNRKIQLDESLSHRQADQYRQREILQSMLDRKTQKDLWLVRATSLQIRTETALKNLISDHLRFQSVFAQLHDQQVYLLKELEVRFKALLKDPELQAAERELIESLLKEFSTTTLRDLTNNSDGISSWLEQKAQQPAAHSTDPSIENLNSVPATIGFRWLQAMIQSQQSNKQTQEVLSDVFLFLTELISRIQLEVADLATEIQAIQNNPLLSGQDQMTVNWMIEKNSIENQIIPRLNRTLEWSVPLSLRWYHAVPEGESNCIRIHEQGDVKEGWDNNYLCSNIPLKWAYSQSGVPQGVWTSCAKIFEPSEGKKHWDNNFLCVGTHDPATQLWHGPRVRLQFSHKEAIPNLNCIATPEPSDDDNWDDNHLCWSVVYE